MDHLYYSRDISMSEANMLVDALNRKEADLAAAQAEREACALMCQAKGEEAMARAVSPEKWNPRDPVYYSSHQEGIAKAHFEDAEAIRARGAAHD